MFPEDILSQFVLQQLEEDLARYVLPRPEPLPCDRWIARSCLQKAIRRGEVQIAQHALATLLEEDRYGIWRHLTIIALEDVGVAEMDTVAQVVFAGRDRSWRKARGGEWAVASFLVQRMAEGTHCQAACDLLLHALNSPDLDAARADVLDAEPELLISMLGDEAVDIREHGFAALALGGGLAEGQPHHEAATVFEVLAGQGYSSHVVAACFAAWRTSGNPMALLLPLVWRRWIATGHAEISNDPMPICQMIGQVPEYAIDQFTRIGGRVARAYLTRDHAVRSLLDEAGIPRAQQPRAIGDVIFVTEGSLLKRRAISAVGDQLRLPARALPGAIRLGPRFKLAVDHIQSKADLISQLRRDNLHQMEQTRRL